jgi:hypothetical protein
VTYNELTRRYFEQPARVGTLVGPECYRGAAGSRSAGTWVQFDIRVTGTGSRACVHEVRFLAFGCPHVIAAAGLVAEEGEGAEGAGGGAGEGEGGEGEGPAHQPRLPQSIHSLRERLDAPVEKLGRLFVVEDAWIAALRAAYAHIAQSSC